MVDKAVSEPSFERQSINSFDIITPRMTRNPTTQQSSILKKRTSAEADQFYKYQASLKDDSHCFSN